MPPPRQARGNAEQANPSCSSASQIGNRRDRVRHRRQPAETRRQGIPRRPLQGRAALDGDDHAGGGRAVRPRHRRGQGRAQRQPADRSDQRRLRRDPGRVRRGEAGHPADRRQRRPAPVHAQPDELRRAGDHRHDQRRRRRTRPTRRRSAPTRSARRSRRPNATNSASSRSCSRACSGRPSGPRTRASGRSWKPATATPTSPARR